MWTKLTDDVHDHPKVVIAGNAAFGVWVRALSYCSRHLTDGVLPAPAIDAMIVDGYDPPDLADRLESSRLMTRSGSDYLVPDYLDFNPSAAEVRARRAAISAKRAAAGRAGGKRSGEVRRARRAPATLADTLGDVLSASAPPSWSAAAQAAEAAP